MKHLFFPLLFAVMMSSCGNDVHTNEAAAEPVTTPEALQDNSSEYSLKGRSSSNLLDELYKELADKDPALKKLEESIAKMKDHPEEAGKLNRFREKNMTYYNDAETMALSVSDSVLKKQLLKMIRESLKKDSIADVPMSRLEARINNNTLSIRDYHSALMIAKTLPVIEKYQSDNRLPLLPWQKFAKEQEDLLKEIKKNVGE